MGIVSRPYGEFQPRLLEIAVIPGVAVQEPESPVSIAAQKALDELCYQSFENTETIKLKYGQFLRNVEASLSELTKDEMPPIDRLAVASKLSELAIERITQKESRFSWIHNLFHKIGQVFRLHGFRTKGEWGLAVAKEMIKTHPIEMDLIGTRPEVMTHINGLPKEKFKEILTGLFFNKRTGMFLGNDKSAFYRNLSVENQKIFKEALVARKDWYLQALDIIEDANEEELNEFITPEMIDMFIKLPSKEKKLYEIQANKYRVAHDDPYKTREQRFYDALSEKAPQKV